MKSLRDTIRTRSMTRRLQSFDSACPGSRRDRGICRPEGYAVIGHEARDRHLPGLRII
jgi:hypothetical protein